MQVSGSLVLGPGSATVQLCDLGKITRKTFLGRTLDQRAWDYSVQYGSCSPHVATERLMGLCLIERHCKRTVPTGFQRTEKRT